MATQYDPIAKDASLNTTENPSRNLADVIAQSLAALIAAMPATVLNNLADVVITLPSDGQTLKYDSATQKWVNANDAGGHTIENPAGTDMTQRANLQFADAHLTDDSVNDRTEVENIKDITSADYANATEDGFYNVTDELDEELTAADIPYDSNDSIKEKIDELSDVVLVASVTADGVKTIAQLLDSLTSHIGELTKKSKLTIGNDIYNIAYLGNGYARFTELAYKSTSSVEMRTISMTAGTCSYVTSVVSNSVSTSDQSSLVLYDVTIALYK